MRMRDRRVTSNKIEYIGNDPALEALAAEFDATNMSVVIADARAADCPIIFANAAFCKLTQYPIEEIVGRNCRFLQGPDTDPTAVAHIRESISRAKPITIDILNYKKSGETFWNALSMAPVFEDGAARFYFSCQLDATERHRAAMSLEVALDHEQHRSRTLADDVTGKQEKIEKRWWN